MAWSKEDRSFKILIGKRVTSNAKAYYEEFGAPTLDLQFQFIKTDNIPFNDPALAVTNGVGGAYSLLTLRKDASVLNEQSYYAATGTGVGTPLTDWISDQNGAGFLAKLYDANDQEIPVADACQWFFDYPTGILTFNGSTASKAKPFKISGWRYIGKKGGALDVAGKIGQKPVHDQDYFPTGISANGKVPVFRSATDRYELEDLPQFQGSSIILVTKNFVTNGGATYTVDTSVAKVVCVFIGGVFQTEGQNYTRSGRVLTFTEGLTTNYTLTVVYFESLASVIVSSVQWEKILGNPSASAALTQYIHSLSNGGGRITHAAALNGATTLDVTGYESTNEITISSSSSMEELNALFNVLEYYPIRIYPSTSLTLTIKSGLGGGNLRCEGNADAKLVGANGDWIEFTRRGDLLFQTNIGNYDKAV